MSGNFSRYARQRDKLYSRVPQLQGAMLSDADSREREDVAAQLDQGGIDLAIGSGVPRDGGVLAYDTAAGPADVVSATALQPGRVVADGIWGEVRTDADLSGAAPLALISAQAGYLLAQDAPASGRFLLFADVWDRHVGAAEDARLVDPAFLSAETSVRRQRMAQLKLLPVSAFDAESDRATVEEGLPVYGDLRLTHVELTGTTPVEDPCDPCVGTIEGTAESGNALFRIEVHNSPFDRPQREGKVTSPILPTSGSRRIMLKFSRDNAGLEVPGSMAQTLVDDPALVDFVFEIATVGGEQALGVDTRPGVPRGADLVNLSGLEAAIPGGLDDRIIRVWDGAVVIDPEAADLAPIPIGGRTATGEFQASGGSWQLTLRVLDLALEFEGEERSSGAPFILPGDAWSVEIREFADLAGDRVFWHSEPVDVEHHYVFVGRVRNRALETETEDSDFRSRHFPALTELDAQQVAWSNHHHTDVETNTVQGAIDLLWARDVGGGEDCHCTVCIDPEKSLADQLEEIVQLLTEAEADKPGLNLDSARICFPRGNYRLERTVVFEQLGHLTLQGAGRDATEIALEPGAALKVADCAALDVADIAFVTEDKEGAPSIVVKDCDRIDIRRCLFGGGPAPSGDGTVFALLEMELPDIAGSAAWITDNVFAIAHNRTALWLVGGGLQCIERNTVTGPGVPGRLQPAWDIPRILGRVEFVPMPSGITPGAASGIFGVGGSRDHALDLTDFPMNEREEVFAFINSGAGLLLEDGIASPEDWSTFRDAATAGGVAIEERRTEGDRPARPATPTGGGGRGGGAGRTTVRVRGRGRTAPERASDAVVIARRGTRGGDLSGAAITGMMGLPAAVSPALAAVLSAPSVDAPEIGDFEMPSFTEDRWRDLEGIFDRFRDRVAVSSFRRAFGFVVDTAPRTRCEIAGNRFDWVHSAIVVLGQIDQEIDILSPTGHVRIEGNQIVRTPQKERTEAILRNLLCSAGITCDNAGALTLTDNTIRQLIRTPSEADDYADGYLVDEKKIRGPETEGHSAIVVRGAVGPVLQAVGNEASYLRFCVYVDGVPAWDKDDGDDNPLFYDSVWTFRRNAVLPAFPTSAGADVRLPGGAPQNLGHVRLIPWRPGERNVEDDNHPPMFANR